MGRDRPRRIEPLAGDGFKTNDRLASTSLDSAVRTLGCIRDRVECRESPLDGRAAAVDGQDIHEALHSCLVGSHRLTGAFQRLIAGNSRYALKTFTVPVSRRKFWPAAIGQPSHRAASDRST